MRSIDSRLLLISAAWLLAAAAAQAQPAPAPGVPLMKPPLASASAAAAAATPRDGAFRTISWDVLVPAGWDPFKDFRGVNLQALNDGDPRAQEMLSKMRQAWDSAPVNPALVGQAVRIPGFVVPLEDSDEGLKEFLLVPYFGACVHSPPPPSNQIIHVVAKSGVKGVKSMDAVWASGTLSNAQNDSFMGASSWHLDAVSVAPYAEPKRR